MKRSYYLYSDGEIHRKDNTLQFTSADGSRRDLPVERITDIYAFSQMNLNTAFLNFLGAHGITLHFFNYFSFYTGSFYPREQLLAGDLLVKQVQHYTDAEKRLDLARRFVDTAAANIYRNLRYYNGRGKEVSGPMNLIDFTRRELPKAKTIPEVMGYEGTIRKIYYETWNTLVDQPIDFTRRVKNPPDNMINTLISFVNSLIYTKVLTEIYQTQLNPTVSFLHEPGVRRFSLSLDLAEIFKPLLGDRLIFSLLNRKQITEKSFTRGLNFLHLTKDSSQTILQALDERLETTIFHKDLDKKVSYRYLIRLECYKLVKHILGEKPYEGFKIWW
ncbi:MAG: type I-B CRISPR-associated endonuclease Cas1b [Planctomycetia bacterium]|nr:type I-B CRISPR-associated endonuclease Cas1b [Planctomycetia bacterium]